MSINLRIGAWYGDSNLIINTPENTEVKVLNPTDSPSLSKEQIEKLVQENIQSKTFQEILTGQSVCLVIDDITRPTPVQQVLGILLQELIKKYEKRNICILIATGAHKPMDADEIEKKLGKNIPSEISIINHDFTGKDIEYLGELLGGPLYLNKHFISADVRITLGGIMPHNETGFGGGAKLVVPGIAGAETIAFFHGALSSRKVGEKQSKTLDKRAWSEAAARKVGVDFAFIITINSQRKICGIEAGDIVESHKRAAKKCRETGETIVGENDIKNAKLCIVNCYPLDSDPIQMGKALLTAKKIFNGQIIIVNNASDGVFYHGMGMGSGIDTKRLLKNLFRVFKFQQLKHFCKTNFKLIFRPKLLLRYTYFFFNILPFGNFRQPSAVEKSKLSTKQENKLVVYSSNFPTGGLKQKYPKAKLIQKPEILEQFIDNNFRGEKIIILPVAPMQIIKRIDF